MSKMYDTALANNDIYDLTVSISSQLTFNDENSGLLRSSSSMLALNNEDLSGIDLIENNYCNKTTLKKLFDLINYKSDAYNIKLQKHIKMYTYKTSSDANRIFDSLQKSRETYVCYHADLQQANIYVSDIDIKNVNNFLFLNLFQLFIVKFSFLNDFNKSAGTLS